MKKSTPEPLPSIESVFAKAAHVLRGSYRGIAKGKPWLDYTVTDSVAARDAAVTSAVLGVAFARASKEAEWLRVAGGLPKRTRG